MSLQQPGPTTSGCISESIRGRSREGRAAYPEVHCEMGGSGDRLQTDKFKFKDKNLCNKHLTGAEKLCYLSSVKICLGDDQNTIGKGSNLTQDLG